MKKTIFYLLLPFFYLSAQAQDTTFHVGKDTLLLQNIEVTSIRASGKTPFTKTDLTKYQIEKENLGYDLPYILDQTPSVVVGSDAGNGVGYTNIRIRGSDATRINVTLNGVPFNDAESQELFCLYPDIVRQSVPYRCSVASGQAQMVGAFGASINLSTNE